MLVSICMIVRNEEAILPEALQSVNGLADEIVIVDTGSEDGTAEVAREFGAHWIEGGDRYHKSEARNMAIDAANGDWIVILDADERIADPEGLREHLKRTNADAIYIRLAFMNGDRQSLSYQQMRIWRRGMYRYKYRAHEVPVPTNGWGKIEHTDFVWEHRPPTNRTWKSDYTLKRLRMDVEENPGDARPVYYLARQLMYCEEWQESIELSQRYLDLGGGNDSGDAYANIAKCYAGLGNTNKQREYLYLACSVAPQRREWWGALAELYHAQGQDRVAVGLLKCALEQEPPGKAYQVHNWYGAHTHDLLARCLWKLRRFDEGREHAIKAVKLEPNNKRLRQNLLFFEDARQKKALELQSTDAKKCLFLALRDNAGVASRYAQAVDGLDGYAARSVVKFFDYFQYPKDVVAPTEDELSELLEWSDALFVFDDYPREGLPDKPIAAIYTGSVYRRNFRAYNARDMQAGVKQFCTTIDLEQFGAEWLPVPMEKTESLNRKRERFTVVHAPTKRHKKGTGFVEKLTGVDVDIIENVANAECMARKASGHVLIDQFELGYGVNALEAWALGLPVVANAREDVLRRIKQRVGFFPFVQSKPEQLQETVNALRSNGLYDQMRQRGFDYLSRFHDPVKVAEQLVAGI